MRIFLEERDAVKPKDKCSQSQASQEISCDHQGPCHHDLHWAGKLKQPEMGMRNNQRNNQRNDQRSLHYRFLAMSFLESPSSPVAIALEPANPIPVMGQAHQKLYKDLNP